MPVTTCSTTPSPECSTAWTIAAVKNCRGGCHAGRLWRLFVLHDPHKSLDGSLGVGPGKSHNLGNALVPATRVSRLARKKLPHQIALSGSASCTPLDSTSRISARRTMVTAVVIAITYIAAIMFGWL
jgi:hypothetical protein